MGVVMCVTALALAIQQPAIIQLTVTAAKQPVAGAQAIVAGHTSTTDAEGHVRLDVSPGPVEITVVKERFNPVTVTATAVAGLEVAIEVPLEKQTAIEEQVTVSATRTDKRLEDVPMRVEVLSADEIAEHVSMTPGDIVMMLNEMGGLRVQATSPSLGAASIRIQGMRGRYSRFLSDGLPLFGAQVGGLGVLQIPPTDLAQVEVIKGVASALYGAGAIGGVVNLVTRRPEEHGVEEFLVNRSSRGVTDAVAFLSGPIHGDWGASLLTGGHWQERNDIDGDGWADIAGYSRAEVRPRVFFDNQQGRSLFVTAGATWESRSGGTMPGSTLAATQAPYEESLDTGRYDVGVSAQALLANGVVLSVRGSAAWQNHDHLFGDVRERDRHDTAFGEVAARRHVGQQTFVVGGAVERDAFDARDVPQFSYAFTTPGVFAQDDVDVTPWLTLSGSARLDHNTTYGTFFSPRGSVLLKTAGWVTRLSAGTGFSPATPLTEETEAAGLSRLRLLGTLRAETGQSASIDVTHSNGPLSYTATVFASRIVNPEWVNRETAFTLESAAQPTTNIGSELLATWRRAPLSITANYVFVHARQFEETAFYDVPLTPRHAFGLVGVWERKDAWRIGLESYYTGRQRLEANPYRDESAPYTLVGMLVERVIGWVRVFVNGENLTNVRQTQFDPLVRPTRGVDGRWTVDAWSPLDGRNVNAGVRVKF
jgi:iron complex outermembrane receptor protein